MVELIPTIMAHSKKELKERLDQLRGFRTVQLDIMDGKFVDNTSITASALKGLDIRQHLEIHLMTLKPKKYAKSFLPYAKRIIIHYESCNAQELVDVVNMCKKEKVQAGLAISPGTTVEDIAYLIPIFDCILVLGVIPGHSGSTFMPPTLKKFPAIRKHSKKIKLEFDGGAHEKTIKRIVKAGAQRIAVGSYFHVEKPLQAKKKLLSYL